MARPGPVATARLAVQSARCGLAVRRRGFAAGLVTCEGRLPVLHGDGTVRVGRLALSGVAAPVELGATGGGLLQVGDRAFLNQGATLVATLSITVGTDFRLGDYAAVYDSGYHPVDQASEVERAPVRIGDNVWIARGAIVLPGVTVGDHAVVAAGSLVTKDVSARTLVAGNPAKPIRELTAETNWRRP